eukprot:149073-Amphidinium_carterae.1
MAASRGHLKYHELEWGGVCVTWCEAQGGCSVQNDATTDLCSEASKLCTECAGPVRALAAQ